MQLMRRHTGAVARVLPVTQLYLLYVYVLLQLMFGIRRRPATDRL